MTTEIETYLNSLSHDILSLNVSNRSIKSLPDLTRFKNLKELHCSKNQLSSLPMLPETLERLFCSNNQLSSLPMLPETLERLFCYNNQLSYLPTLPKNLKELYCSNNRLSSLPMLPETLERLYCYNNPIYKIIYKIVNNDTLFQIKKNIQILNNFRHLYYCLKFKKQFRKWLWETVREPSAKKLYHPDYLVENLKEEDDLDTVLNNWK